MKLSTMLLPTGEFIIVGSGVAHDRLPSKEVLSNFQDQTGAASILFCDQEVEVEDAIVDPDARRHEPDAKLPEYGPPPTPGIHWLDSWYDVRNRLYHSPKRASTTNTNEWTHVEPDEQLAANVQAEEFLPDPFPVGARVEIIGPPVHEHHEHHKHPGNLDEKSLGRKGRVTLSFLPLPEDQRNVEFRMKGKTYNWYFPVSSLQPIPATLESSEEGVE